MKRYYALSTYFRQRFGQRVRKIPLDAGFSCPNRDGFLSRKGCLFCNPLGSGTGLKDMDMSLQKQWMYWYSRFMQNDRHKEEQSGRRQLYLAYLQSYSNTYGPIEKLKEVLDQLFNPVSRHPLPGLTGLAIGTRPDCLEDDKIRLLAEQPTPEIWLDIGLQSASDSVLERINRGHTVAQFTDAVERVHALAEHRIKICVHVIAGLPGEDLRDVVQTVRYVDTLPVHGIKFHNLYVARGAGLERLWEIGDYVPPERDDYVAALIECLCVLRPDIVIHRLGSDPARGELLAPDWAARKRELLNRLDQLLADWNSWQGKERDGSSTDMPQWFDPAAHLPPSLTPRIEASDLEPFLPS